MKFILFSFLILSGMTFSQETEEAEPLEVMPEVLAEFPGGPTEMKKFIQENIQYPDIAKELGDQGRVYIQFIVEADGSISEISVVKGVTSELDAEGVRLVKMMPNWSPGEFRGKAVRTRCVLPITFTLLSPKSDKKHKKELKRLEKKERK